jgi:hypothetical protein
LKAAAAVATPCDGGDSGASRARRELRTFFAEHADHLNRIVVISDHAIDRFRERVRSELSNLDCRRVLYASMRRRGQFTPMPPQWLFHAAKDKVSRENIGYIVIDDWIALPLRVNVEERPEPRSEAKPYIAVTCLSAEMQPASRSSSAAVAASTTIAASNGKPS